MKRHDVYLQIISLSFSKRQKQSTLTKDMGFESNAMPLVLPTLCCTTSGDGPHRKNRSA